MAITKKQREIVIGLVIGDGFLQKTGKKNARLRLEHSVRQKDYIFWKHEMLSNLMQSRPKRIKRYNPIWGKSYSYYRCQSHSSPIFGQLRRQFYNENGKKIIPTNIGSLLKSPLTLAVWYMDDGYLYHRDKSVYSYLAKHSEEEVDLLSKALKDNFNLASLVKLKKGKFYCLCFNVQETAKLIKIIKPYVIPSLNYKLLLTP